MDSRNLIYWLSGFGQIYIFNVFYQMLEGKCAYKVRLFLVECIYIVFLAIIYMQGLDFIVIIGVSLLEFAFGNMAYETAKEKRLYCMLTGFGIIFISFIISNTVKVSSHQIDIQFFLMDIIEIVVFFMMRQISGIAKNTHRNQIYVLVGIYFFAVANIIRTLFLKSEYMTTIIVFFILIHVLALLGIDAFLKMRSQTQEHNALNKQVQYYENELKLLDAYHTNIRGIRHDLNNHMDVLRSILQNGDCSKAIAYIDTLQIQADISLCGVDTGNYEIDAILNSKLSIMKKERITYQCRAIIPENLDVEAVDMIIIVGNVIDNAVTAVKAFNQKNKNGESDIDIELIYMRGILAFSVKNRCKNDGKAFCYSSVTDGKQIPDFLKTTKKNKDIHGIGMNNVLKIVEKYDGYMRVEKVEGVFQEYIELCIS